MDCSVKKFDFRLETTRAIPMYAIPRSATTTASLMLRNSRFDAEFAFADLASVMRFQQALTGFKPYDFYSQYVVQSILVDLMLNFIRGNALVSLVVSRQTPVVEFALVQLWIPKAVKGELSVEKENGAPSIISSQQSDVASIISEYRRDSGNSTPNAVELGPSSPTLPTSPSLIFRDPFGINNLANLTLQDQPISPRSASPQIQPYQPGQPYQPPPTQIPPTYSNPPTYPNTSLYPNSALYQHPSAYQTSSPYQDPQPYRTSPPYQHSPSFPHSPSYQPSPPLSSMRRPSVSTFSSHSTPQHTSPSFLSTSTKASDTTITPVSIGHGPGVGYVHSKPLKPMLVLFTKSQRADETLSIIAIQIDHDTEVNPERCECRRKQASCCDVAIERKQGSANLLAQRYQSNEGLLGYDVARLSATKRHDLLDNEWDNVQRISIRFANPNGKPQYRLVTSKC
jgi:hypothetical protein